MRTRRPQAGVRKLPTRTTSEARGGERERAVELERQKVSAPAHARPRLASIWRTRRSVRALGGAHRATSTRRIARGAGRTERAPKRSPAGRARRTSRRQTSTDGARRPRSGRTPCARRPRPRLTPTTSSPGAEAEDRGLRRGAEARWSPPPSRHDLPTSGRCGPRGRRRRFLPLQQVVETAEPLLLLLLCSSSEGSGSRVVHHQAKGVVEADDLLLVPRAREAQADRRSCSHANAPGARRHPSITLGRRRAWRRRALVDGVATPRSRYGGRGARVAPGEERLRRRARSGSSCSGANCARPMRADGRLPPRHHVAGVGAGT